MLGDGAFRGQGDVGARVDPAQLRRFEERVEEGRHLCAALGPRAVVVLAAYYDA